jgi:16S rRNA processing protein RimM
VNSTENRIALGVIRKPHGVRGEASVDAWTELDRFLELERVTIVSPDEASTREVRIEAVRAHLGRALVKFEGIDSPEDLALYRGWTVEIPENEARKLESDEYFLHDLVGLTLVDESGAERGRVVDAYEGGGGVLLEVERNGKKFDVPFAAEICRTIDLAEKRIVVALPEGLDEV